MNTEPDVFLVYEDDETGWRWIVEVGSVDGATARGCHTVFGPATRKECEGHVPDPVRMDAIAILETALAGYEEHEGATGYVKLGDAGNPGEWACTDNGVWCNYDHPRAFSFTLNGAVYWAVDQLDLPMECPAWKRAMDAMGWILENAPTDVEVTDPGEWSDLPDTKYGDVLGLLQQAIEHLKSKA